MSTPSAYEQLSLELINLLRTDPGGEYARLVAANDATVNGNMNFFGVNQTALQQQFAALTAVAPLAWNTLLAQSSHTHSDRMIRLNDQQHNFPGEPNLQGKFDAVGYPSNSWKSENIFTKSSSAFVGHAAFVVDWGYDDVDRNADGSIKANFAQLGDGIQDPPGHRDSLMSTNYTEIGIGVIEDTDPNNNVGPYVTTHHLGGPASGYLPQFIGVVINDTDNDEFYDIGEGMGGVTVTFSGTGGTFSTTTWASGGYQLAVTAGTYTITFSGGGLNQNVVKQATLGANNVKVDAINPAAAANTAPVVDVPNQTRTPEEWVRLSDIATFTDADGNAITNYEVWDSTGGNNWWSGGSFVNAQSGYQTTNLAGLWLQADAAAGTQTLWVRANDGTDWSAWEQFLLTTASTNVAPVTTANDTSLATTAWAKVNTFTSATDADGNAITQYEVWDSSGGGNFWMLSAGGYLDASAGFQMTAAQFSGLWIQGDATPSTQNLWVRAHDGTEWGNWDSFAFTTTSQNTKPSLAVENVQVASGLWLNSSQIDPIFTDADGDAATQYEIWDNAGGNNFWAASQGGFIDASSGFVMSAADAADLWLQGDATASAQTLWMRAHDGTEWSDWDSFVLTTV